MEFQQFKKEARRLKIKKSASYLRWSDKDEGFRKLSWLFKIFVRISCPSAEFIWLQRPDNINLLLTDSLEDCIVIV